MNKYFFQKPIDKWTWMCYNGRPLAFAGAGIFNYNTLSAICQEKIEKNIIQNIFPKIVYFAYCFSPKVWYNEYINEREVLFMWFAFYCFLVAIVSLIMYKVIKRTNAKKWNKGTCSMCGGKFQFKGASSHLRTSRYYYTCSNCGHTIEVTELMK